LRELDFCPQLRDLYETRRTVGRSGKTFDELGALSTINNLMTLRSLMFELKPTRTLEIGMAFGGSALTFAQSHKDLRREPFNQHTAIDPAQSKYWDDAGRLLLENASLEDYVEVIESYSSQALPRLIEEGRRFEMVYIDGSHQFEDVLMDFVFTHEMLEVDGVVLFDDATDSHVAKVLRFLETNYDEVYAPVPLSRFRVGLGSQLRYRAASYLRRTQMRAYRKLKDGRQNWGKPLKAF
jgi:predicted O-methyltransferase YrrM